ncbi:MULTISPECIES: aldehyde dehydrogenase family protein [unclassified Frankia]|uniref:aldehyde dehydrogenase family protein n=1 Tax=unclassified Frankia TaxID=2632575 RepID=UPI000460D4E6|nr:MULTISPECIES: aldehyde dehydrogenase family protein [unclassified Frankia]KDA43099.1 NAD-dependent aldehyde dehydrogenase [Frankia sp. BMG5.23]ORT47727.1 aldehyde dehydrogenase [Frankia sp. KB5]
MRPTPQNPQNPQNPQTVANRETGVTEGVGPAVYPAAGIGTLLSTDPATGAVVASFPVMEPTQVRAAVASARSAAGWWAGLAAARRRDHLLRWAAHLVRHETELIDLLHAENGKTAADARIELLLTLEHIRWAARNAARVLRTRRVSPGPFLANHTGRIEYRPFGVVGVIGPWNYPLFTPSGSIAYALAAGNTVVFKPSEYTPAVGAYLVAAFAAANPDAPAGVLTMVTGFGPTGAALCTAGVDKIAFTGSPATGRLVMAACASSLVPVVIECGGKDPLIVADDADVAAAARAAAWGAMSNGGQTCAGVERIYVTEAVAAPFLAALRRELDGVRPGADRDASYGPMTMPGQAAIVRRHVADALARGATALIGGTESVGDTFIEPVVLVDVPEGSPAVQEETFGPVATVRTVADVDEAVTLANGTPYALGATVFSRSRGDEIASRLDAGMVSVNAVLAFAGMPALPFGGSGESGFGRVHGAEGLREFVRPRSVATLRMHVPGATLTTFRRAPGALAVTAVTARLRHGGGWAGWAGWASRVAGRVRPVGGAAGPLDRPLGGHVGSDEGFRPGRLRLRKSSGSRPDGR